MRRDGARLIAAGSARGGSADTFAADGSRSVPSRGRAHPRFSGISALRSLLGCLGIIRGFRENHSSLPCKTLFGLLRGLGVSDIVQSCGRALRIEYSLRNARDVGFTFGLGRSAYNAALPAADNGGRS